MRTRGRPKGPASTARCYRLNDEVGVMLDKYSEDTGMPRTAIVEKALLLYFSSLEGGRDYENIKV